MHTYIRENHTQAILEMADAYKLTKRDVIDGLLTYALANGGQEYMNSTVADVRKRKIDARIEKLRDKISELEASKAF